MFRSLRLRLALSHALVLMVLLMALGFTFWFLLDRSLDTAVTQGLTASAQGVVRHIQETSRPVPPPDADVPSQAGVQMAVYAEPGGHVVGERREIPEWLKRYPERVTDVSVAGEDVRVVVLPAVVDGQTIAWVAAGRSTLAETLLLQRVGWLLLAGGAAAVVVSLGAGWWLAGRAVRPVERAYRAQAGFAADASHELRTPLTFIRQGVEVLAQHDAALGRDVLSDVDYLSELTQRLLQLARAESGTSDLSVSPVDVTEAVRSSARRSELAHGNRLALDGGPSQVLADHVALEAVMDALLENVARHAGGAAEVTWRGDVNRVQLFVIDHGPGIPDDLRDRASDRFFRVDASRARETGGAGLGLALASALIHAQGGSLALTSTSGGGLTVVVTLPATGPQTASTPRDA